MMCESFKQFELSELDESFFQKHARNCAECQQLLAQDQKLLAFARSLNRPVPAPLLWAKIENQIRTEKNRRRKWTMAGGENWQQILRLAAVVLLAFTIGFGGYFFFKPNGIESQNILAANALKRVEKMEREYVSAIAALEATADPQMDRIDIELQLLYRDRLATIDAQIQRCREALAENPASAHIRRYLLAALQDKKQTLSEITELEDSLL
jgi:hypothetical protein